MNSRNVSSGASNGTYLCDTRSNRAGLGNSLAVSGSPQAGQLPIPVEKAPDAGGNNHSDMAPIPEKVSLGVPPDHLVKLLNFSGWKVEFRNSSGSYVYVSPSGQAYWSLSKVLEAFLHGTDTGKKEVDAKMGSSPATENLEPIMHKEPMQEMATSQQVNLVPDKFNQRATAESGSSPAAGMTMKKPLPPGAVLALPCVKNKGCGDTGEARMPHINKGKQVAVDDGSDRQLQDKSWNENNHKRSNLQGDHSSEKDKKPRSEMCSTSVLETRIQTPISEKFTIPSAAKNTSANRKNIGSHKVSIGKPPRVHSERISKSAMDTRTQNPVSKKFTKPSAARKTSTKSIHSTGPQKVKIDGGSPGKDWLHFALQLFSSGKNA